MSSQEKRWNVKDGEGKIWGPYSTEQVLEQISRGYYVGGEQVSIFPGGQWISISKTPEFYDMLLDVLVQEGKSSKAPTQETAAYKQEITEKVDIVPGGELSRPTNAPSPSERTEIARVPVSREPSSGPANASINGQTNGPTSVSVNVPANRSAHQTVANLPQATSRLPAQQTRTKNSTRTQAAPNIELTDIKSIEEKESGGGSNRLPLFLIAIALILAAYVLFGDDGGKGRTEGNRVHLLAPRKGQLEVAEPRAVEKYQRALAAFQNDTFSSYQKAQNELVEIVEGASPKAEAAAKKAERMAFLCLVYRELWPYSYQDSRDLQTVSLAMQEAKRLDPGGKSGGTCEVVSLILNGRARDAQGLIDNMLVEESQTPVLFEIRGDLYSYIRDYQDAGNYFEQARVLWPQWQKISLEEGRAKMKTQKFPEAEELYRSVLAKVPTHPVAKIELGLMEASVFQKPDEASALLRSALDGKERMPDVIASAGWLGLAKIQEQKNLTSKAGDYALKAYKLNAANLEAKAMVERLKGKVSAPGPKEAQGLIYLGDQYYSQGDYFAAQAQYKTAFEADPKSGISAMKAARCLWALNQSMDAIDWMKKAVAADSQLTVAYVYLAEYYARRFDFISATQILAKAQRLQPNSYEVYRGFANVELIRNNFKDAVKYGQRSLKLYETDLETYLIMAKANIGLRNFEDAEHFAAKAIELDYNNIEAQGLYGKSEAGLRGTDAGANYMKNLIKRFVIAKGQQVPAAAIDYRITLGEIYLNDEKYHDAEEAFQQAISLDADNKRGLMGLAKTLQAENQQARSLETFLRAAVLDPSDADPIYYSGNLYAEVGKTKEALKQFERVLKINSRYPRAHVALGRMYLRNGDGKAALDQAMKEREINPGLQDSFLLAAESYFQMKQYTNCAQEYQQGARGSRDASILTRMARCYRLSGALESAQSLLKQAQSIESGNPEIYKEQGAIFQSKGMADESLAAYDTYLKLVPAASDRAEIENRMERVRKGDLDVGP